MEDHGSRMYFISRVRGKQNVAKCNLGKVNLEAMLSSNLWMQEARLQPWRFAGALCDAYTQ